MAVQFILGRSGTGKSSLCIREICEALAGPDDEGSLVLLVPEQATYQAERAILTAGRLAGYHRLRVLSFRRLEHLLLGHSTVWPRLSDIGRQMAVQRILREHRQRLQVFGESAQRPGLGRELAETISELQQCTHTPDEVKAAAQRLQADSRSRLVGVKLAEIALILEKYLEFIEGGFLDADVQLNRARRSVGTSEFLVGASLWVDGFSSFTGSELAVLAEMLKVAARVRIALCLDSRAANPECPEGEADTAGGLFYSTHRTYCELLKVIGRSRLQPAEPIVLREAVRFSGSAALAHIERHLFDSPGRKICAGESVELVAAANQRCEVRYVARRIRRLVREKKLRYRDIAVIAPDVGTYEHYIRACFEDYEIPFFIDRRKGLGHHPVVVLVCSALRAAVEGFGHNEMFAYLKTDLSGLDRSEVDTLENYCLAFGIEGGEWVSERDWVFAPAQSRFDETLINRLRKKAVEPVQRLRLSLALAGSGGSDIVAERFIQSVFGFLERLGVRAKLAEWIADARRQGDYAQAEEHRQFYDCLVELFDEMGRVFSGRKMSCADWFLVLRAAFAQMTLAFIPPNLDQVLVGSIERSRHPNLKAVFLIGTTQKQFPTPLSGAGVLSDRDREAAESAELRLGPGTESRLAERQYLAYIALTRASSYLCISYPLVDEKGRPVARSAVLEDLESLFEDVQERSVGDGSAGLEQVETGAELSELMCSRLGRDVGAYRAGPAASTAALLEAVCGDADLSAVGSAVRQAIGYENVAELDAQLAGENLESTASRLSCFAACPYQYFARYVLQLRRREEFKLQPLDLGTFYHQLLDSLIKRFCAEGRDISQMDEQSLVTAVRKTAERVLQTNSFIANFAAHKQANRSQVDSAIENLERFVIAMAEMIGAGIFRPQFSEVSFGSKDDPLGRFEIDMDESGRLSLHGKIDRLDIAEIDGRKMAVVFDYKRSGKSFSWSRFYNGLDIQLPLYLAAVRGTCRRQGIDDVVGGFFLPVESNPKPATFSELAGRGEKFDYKAKGLFNGTFWRKLEPLNRTGNGRYYSFYVKNDEQPYGNYDKRSALRPEDFENVLSFTESKVRELAAGILAGRIAVRPYRLGHQSPCSGCDYKPLCRFDWQINQYHCMKSPGKEQVLAELRQK